MNLITLLGVAGVGAMLFLSDFSELHCVAQPVPAKTFSKAAMLREVAQGVLVAGYADLAAKCRGLTNAAGELTRQTNQTSLENARRAWLAAADAANRIRCYQAGPIAERGSVSAFYYWQVLPNRIESIVNDSSRAIDQSLIDENGATAKGLFAIEYLLFDRRGGQRTEPLEKARALDLLSGSPRRRDILSALTADLEAKAGQIAKDWAIAGGQTPVIRFVSGGQESINLLVNQLARALEDIAENHLHFVLDLQSPVARQLDRIERSRSDSSLQGVLASLEGVRQIYRGAGGPSLADAVEHVNPRLHARLQAQFETALSEIKAIQAPFEQAVVDNRALLQNAYEKTRALEIMLKVDVVSALGVTLTFSSNDGD